MNQRKLYKTIEGFANKKFASSEELLMHVLREIVNNDRLGIQGGRLWKLDQGRFSYVLTDQVGNIEKIRQNYQVRIDSYEMFKQLPKHKTILAKETDEYLRSKGIVKYSATGVGNLVKVREINLYPYVLSFNTNLDPDDIVPTLNIIGVAVTTMLRSRSIEKKKAQLEKDLDRAREIQRSILPEHELVFHNYEVFGISLADRIVGGDFFDYITSEDEDRVGIVIGDAASKGLSAAVQALYVSGAVKMGAAYETKISSLFRRINTLIHKTFSNERFLTLFYIELANDKQGLCIYSNAGHNAPILYRPKTKTHEILESTGQIMGPFPNERYRSEGVLIGKGDILLLYTDGVTEAMDGNNVLFGEHRLIQKLAELSNKSPRETAQQILEDVQKFSAKSKYSDDKTIVVIKRVK